MDSYSIGLSGLGAAQKALDVIGNNIANAATEGYHRQRIELAPAYSSQVGPVLIGGGVEVDRITRIIDTFLEQQILQQQSSAGQVGSELYTLQTVENTLGELSNDSGLSAAIDKFFNALQDLSAHPNEVVWQSQAATAAETMAGQFRALAASLAKLQQQVVLDAGNTIDRVNTLTNHIAQLNDTIQREEMLGGQANNLRDQRDQAIKELSELMTVETQERRFGAVDVNIAGFPAVSTASAMELEVGFDESGQLGIAAAGAGNYYADIQGGRIGALLALKNDILADIQSDFDALAAAIITQINQNHVQGVGSQGSFTQLTGRPMLSENLADFDPPVSDGKIYIRVTDTTTGTVTRHEIDIDASTDSLTTIAADITANVPGLTASVGASVLTITADATHKFDFLPAVLPEPTASTLNGSSPPTISVSGIYTGQVNDTFVLTISGAGAVGNGNLQLEVKDAGGTGDVIATLNIGQGYAAGDPLDLGNGIRISLSHGDFAAGDNVEVDAFADTDTSGVLAAAGINTFFSGSGAANIAVCSRITDEPAWVATALGPDMTDNTNALRMAALRDQALGDLDELTPGQFYRLLVTGVGQQVSIRQMRQDNVQVIAQSLADQQSRISGVDINDEAARMLVFEQMFHAMAQYISTVNSAISTLMELL